MAVKYDEYTRKCKVVVEVNGREHPADKAYELVPTTCDEMIDASRVHEGHHMDNCSKTKTLTASRKEEVAGYTLEIQYLRDEMKHVGKWCTPSPARRKRFTDHLTAATASLLRQQGAQQ